MTAPHEQEVAIALCERWFDTGARASWCPQMAKEFAAALATARQEGFTAALTKVADDFAERSKSNQLCDIGIIEVQAFLDSRHVHYPEAQK